MKGSWPENERPGDGLRHPVALGMLALWIVNDHLFKEMFGNAITGKLSDVAGLVVFPLFLLAGYEWIQFFRKRSAKQRASWLIFSLVFTGAFFTALNVSHDFSDWIAKGLGWLQWPFRLLAVPMTGEPVSGPVPAHATPDWTDLFTLPVLMIPYVLERKRWDRLSTG